MTCDLAPSFGRQALCSSATTLLASEFSERHGCRILPRIGFGAILDNLTCGKIDDEFCQLICVPRTLA
jgi:hypothetical protein